MPCWLAACLDLLSGPFIGYCIALRKLALHAGILRPTGTPGTSKTTPTTRSERNYGATRIKTNVRSTDESKATMPPCAEEKIKEGGPEACGPRNPATSLANSRRKFVGVVIAICGLPGRGKSQVAQSLCRRLNWNGDSAQVMRVSDYRRKKLDMYGSHEFFRSDIAANLSQRSLALREAMQDCVLWLGSGNSIAILDGCLVTREQRAEVFDYLHLELGYRLLFIECSCDDQRSLERNYEEIIRNSADYAGMDAALAAEDLLLRVSHYLRIYEPLDEKNYSRIRIDTVSMKIEAEKISGHVESTVLGYLGSINAKTHTLYFSRHGESEYNVIGKIGGDAALSPRGESYAQALASRMNAMHIPDLRILTSRLRRTIATARGIEASQREHLESLNELDAGVCEGLSYEEMQQHYPQEFAWRDQDKLRYRYPWGESYIDIMHRVEPVIAELQQSNNILVISHQAVLRCLIGFFMDKKPEELPYMEVPLHTILRVTSQGFNYRLDLIKLPIECVNTTRTKPKNCNPNRTADDALTTVPAHYDIPDPWRNPSSVPTLVQQH